MISETSVKKIFLDTGSLQIPDDCRGNVLPFSACYHPEIRGVVQTDSQAGTATIRFDSEAVQNLFLQLSHELGFKTICENTEELYSTASVIHDHIKDFDAILQEPVHENEQEKEFDPDKAETEAEATVKERRGQQIYRKGLEALWGNSCAVTGVSIPEVLRASHAKPWAECASGSERLNPYNGFLLTANLDALFDKFLISFDEYGKILINPELKPKDLISLGISPDMKLRFLDKKHLPFLEYHRTKFFDRLKHQN